MMTSAIFGVIFAMNSCSRAAEQAEVKEEAQQIEEAHLSGREAARSFVSRKWKDSIQLQEQMLEVGVQRSRYVSLPKSRAAFDSAFISTVRTVRPEIAAKLQRYAH